MAWYVIGAAILLAAFACLIRSFPARREDYAVPTLKIFDGCK